MLILAGDLPLLSADTVAELVVHHQSTDSACTIATSHPGGSRRAQPGRARGRDGRIVRLGQGDEPGEDDPQATEVAALAYCVRRSAFRPALRRLTPDDQDGEYRLAGIVEVLVRAGYTVGSVEAPDERDRRGRRPVHLAEVEAAIRNRVNLGWLARGSRWSIPTPSTSTRDRSSWRAT